MLSESFRLVVACCCSCFVIAGSIPLHVLANSLAKQRLIYYPPNIRVHAAAPMLGYTRLPQFRVRHSKPRLFRVAFGGGGRVVGLGHSVVFVCGVCDGQTGPTLGETEDKFADAKAG
jgi:hypothetical protein